MARTNHFLSYLQNLQPAQKERWVWGFSILGVAFVLLVGWMSFGALLPQNKDATALSGSQGINGDVPFFEAMRGGLASIMHVAKSGVGFVASFFSGSHTYTVTPQQ